MTYYGNILPQTQFSTCNKTQIQEIIYGRVPTRPGKPGKSGKRLTSFPVMERKSRMENLVLEHYLNFPQTTQYSMISVVYCIVLQKCRFFLKGNQLVVRFKRLLFFICIFIIALDESKTSSNTLLLVFMLLVADVQAAMNNTL